MPATTRFNAQRPQDRMMADIVRRYGWWGALRFCRNIGISFEDAYFMVFGRLPRTSFSWQQGQPLTSKAA